jgi:adenosine deaminase
VSSAERHRASITDALLLALPKVELHVHLEGTFTADRITDLARAAGESLPRPADQIYVASDLGEFLETLDWVCGLVRDPEAAVAQAVAFAHTAAAQGTAYAEVIVNPTHWSGLSAAELLGAVADGFESAHRAGGADCRVLPSLLRSQPADEGVALVELMRTLAHPRIVGLSIDGNEAAAEPGSSQRFAPAYELARRWGFGTTAHAGESSGPGGVRDALDLLGVSRIDHGVRAVEDASLMGRLAAEGITLNVCLTSNCHLIYPSLADHPIRTLAAAGVPFTINTDDPDTLGVTLTSELALAARHLGWDVDDLVEAQRRAVRASFADDRTKAALTTRLDTFPPA